MEFKIIFQNENVVAIDKPAGVLSVPSRMGESDPRPCIGIELQKKIARKVFPVHRLDFEVSGILLFALNANAHKVLNKYFENKEIIKEYELLATGDQKLFESLRFPLLLESKIVRGKKRSFDAPHGKESITEVVLGEKVNKGLYRFFVKPHTGRPHQIRFEFYRLKFPILGDVLYGSEKALIERFPSGGFKEKEIVLRANSLEFLKIKNAQDLGLPQVLSVDKNYFNSILEIKS